MICPNCGSPVPEDSAYCPVCGMPATTPQAQAGATDIAPYQGEAGQAYSRPTSRGISSKAMGERRFPGVRKDMRPREGSRLPRPWVVRGP